MIRRISPHFYALFLAALILAVCLPTSGSSAQETGIIRGRVVDGVTRRAIPGVRVTVRSTAIEARTDEDGDFELAGLPLGKVVLTFQLPQYGTVIEQVVVGPGRSSWMFVELAPMAILLEELIVTGRISKGEENPGAVAAEDLKKHGTAHTAADLLASEFPGVEVRRGSGGVGTGSVIRIRGVKSLTLPADPVIFVDGVRMSPPFSSSEVGGSGALGILDLIPAESVKHVEVLKGPAATRYGIGAVNGVILIWTRTGSGAPFIGA